MSGWERWMNSWKAVYLSPLREDGNPLMLMLINRILSSGRKFDIRSPYPVSCSLALVFGVCGLVKFPINVSLYPDLGRRDGEELFVPGRSLPRDRLLFL